jgi:hypothetical protein
MMMRIFWVMMASAQATWLPPKASGNCSRTWLGRGQVCSREPGPKHLDQQRSCFSEQGISYPPGEHQPIQPLVIFVIMI